MLSHKTKHSNNRNSSSSNNYNNDNPDHLHINSSHCVPLYPDNRATCVLSTELSAAFTSYG